MSLKPNNVLIANLEIPSQDYFKFQPLYRHDIGAGRGETDMVSAQTTVFGKTFDSICYTADGEAIIAGKLDEMLLT